MATTCLTASPSSVSVVCTSVLQILTLFALLWSSSLLVFSLSLSNSQVAIFKSQVLSVCLHCAAVGKHLNLLVKWEESIYLR